MGLTAGSRGIWRRAAFPGPGGQDADVFIHDGGDHLFHPGTWLRRSGASRFGYKCRGCLLSPAGRGAWAHSWNLGPTRRGRSEALGQSWGTRWAQSKWR